VVEPLGTLKNNRDTGCSIFGPVSY